MKKEQNNLLYNKNNNLDTLFYNYNNSNPNTNLQMNNLPYTNKLKSLTFPSVASSRLGELLNECSRVHLTKEIDCDTNRLHINKNNNGSNKLNSLKKIFKFNIGVLTKYEIELNSYISKESNKNRVYSIISLSDNNEFNGFRSFSTSDKQSLFNTSNNNISKANNSINSNENFNKLGSKDLVMGPQVGLGLGKEISLPLELYPNVSCELGNKGISGLHLDTVKKLINLFSRFSSEIATFQNIGYKFNSGQNHSIKNIISILESSFYPMSYLISKPNFDSSSKKVVLRIFTYLRESRNLEKSFNKIKGFNFLTLYDEQLEILGNILTKIYNKPVELDINRLYLPSSDSTILSKIVGLLSNSVKYKTILYKILRPAKFKNPTKMIRVGGSSTNTLAGKAEGKLIPAYLSGVKVKVAGRLLTQSVIPRRTVSIFQRGCLARGKSNFVNTARFTNKNKRGSYSITVSIGHVFV